MPHRNFVCVARFSLPDGEGDLLVWQYEDRLPPEHNHDARSTVMDDNLTDFHFWHGRGPEDCGGVFRFRNVSTTHVALLCDSCHLRLPLPRATDRLVRLIVFGKSRGWFCSTFFTLYEWNRGINHASMRPEQRPIAKKPPK